jgi:dephospho-CoA kinase
VSDVPASFLRVALTGGMATGKSTCLRRFGARGVPIIDADELAREAVAPGSAGLKAVISRFGPEVLAADGTLDRAALAAIVFADPAARADLEALTHPHVFGRISGWFEEQSAMTARAGRWRFAVADVPLLYEVGRADDFDLVVVAACPVEMQLARIRERDGLSDADARRRLEAQWPIDRKRALADFVVDTSGTIEETEGQVDAIISTLGPGV